MMGWTPSEYSDHIELTTLKHNEAEPDSEALYWTHVHMNPEGIMLCVRALERAATWLSARQKNKASKNLDETTRP